MQWFSSSYADRAVFGYFNHKRSSTVYWAKLTSSCKLSILFHFFTSWCERHSTPWTSCQSAAGLTHNHACLCSAEGSWSTWRNSMQIQGEHGNLEAHRTIQTYDRELIGDSATLQYRSSFNPWIFTNMSKLRKILFLKWSCFLNYSCNIDKHGLVWTETLSSMACKCQTSIPI